MKLSIIIPVFNEEKTITAMLERVDEITLGKNEKEIIIVDDGSSDATAQRIKRFKQKTKEFVFIQHEKNQGKGAAVSTGIKKASGDYIIIQDADLEYNPAYIPKLLQLVLDNKATVVYGTRLNRLPHLGKEEKKMLFLVHFFGNRFLSLTTSILYGQWLTDMETCYKLFPKKAMDNIHLHARRFDFEPEITAKLLKNGYKITEIPITTVPRGYEEGKKLNTVHDGMIALWTLVKYRFQS